jgi:hypothetical protein
MNFTPDLLWGVAIGYGMSRMDLWEQGRITGVDNLLGFQRFRLPGGYWISTEHGAYRMHQPEAAGD